MGVLRNILGQAVEDGILSANVAAKGGKFVPKAERKKPAVFPVDAAEAVLKVGREKYSDINPALLLGFRVGLRIGEICALSWDDVNLEAGEITVRRTNHKGHIDTPKGNRERVIRLSPELDAALRACRARTAESALKAGTRLLYWLRPRRKGDPAARPVYAGWIRDRFRVCVEEAGLPSTGKFHTTRHSFASHLLDDGAPITAVRDLLGHSELATTNKYAHSVGDARAIVGRLDHLKKDANRRKQDMMVEGELQ